MGSKAKLQDGYRKTYHAFGFNKSYNFPLYIITCGAFFAFLLSRLQYLNINGIFFKSTIPGEPFWYQVGYRRVGIIIHFVGVFFGGLLAVLQFTPIIRHKFLWLHRVCGYLSIVLLLLGNAGAFMIIDTSVGGAPAMRVWTGALGTAITFAVINAWVNIKRLQIDQHRAWMIRTWAWTANVISLRLILLAGTHVVKVYNIEMFSVIRCDQIFFMYTENAGLAPAQNPTPLLYPACGANASTNGLQVAVSSRGAGPENIAASARPIFLMAAWLAIIIHILLTEVYLWLTPAESYRLRVVSYEKQVAKGLRAPGSNVEAGLGSTRIGDAPDWWALPLVSYRVPGQNGSVIDHGLVEPVPAKQAELGGNISDDSRSTVAVGR